MSNRFITKFTVNRHAVNVPELEKQRMEEECVRACGNHAKDNYHALHCPYVRGKFGGNQ